MNRSLFLRAESAALTERLVRYTFSRLLNGGGYSQMAATRLRLNAETRRLFRLYELENA